MALATTLLLGSETKEQKAVAMRAGDGLGHSGQGGVGAILVREALGQDLDLMKLTLVAAVEDSPRFRQPGVAGTTFLGGKGITLCRLGSKKAQVGVVGQQSGLV